MVKWVCEACGKPIEDPKDGLVQARPLDPLRLGILMKSAPLTDEFRAALYRTNGLVLEVTPDGDMTVSPVPPYSTLGLNVDIGQELYHLLGRYTDTPDDRSLALRFSERHALVPLTDKVRERLADCAGFVLKNGVEVIPYDDDAPSDTMDKAEA